MEIMDNLYFSVFAYSWVFTELNFWQSVIWPYYAVNGLW